MTSFATQPLDVVFFGPFALSPAERLLTRQGLPIELGARVLDLLIALIARHNEVISKKELLASVWPDVTVEEGSLRFAMARLREALGDGRGGARYITTSAGRGYCFVAPISRMTDGAPAPRPPAANAVQTNLPTRPPRVIGRHEDIRNVARELTTSRLVTIVGTGGIGKTTVAVAVGHEVLADFCGAVYLIDLGALADPAVVTTTIASTLGISLQSEDAEQSLVVYLKDKRILLILDTCEHVIDAVSAAAARIVRDAPHTHILATSREALRVQEEQVYSLAPLPCPPHRPGLTFAEVQAFPAAELFIQLAASRGACLEWSDTEASIVSGICRRLDGVPLAIELAAGRVQGYGLHKVADLLDEHLSLQWPGHRLAPPRQKTLQATLDWSYRLLSDIERAVLRRLAVFVGYFTIEAALEVVRSDSVDDTNIFAAIDGLVAKCMLAPRPAGAMMRYRLLDATRAFALQIDLGEAESNELGSRHAAYYLRWLEATGTEWSTLSSTSRRTLYLSGVANVRAALGWAFGRAARSDVGIRLAVASAPMYLAMSLLTECHRWMQRALDKLEGSQREGREGMHLQAALGVSLMFTRGGKEAARVALEKSLAIARSCNDALDEIQVLAPLQMFHLRTGAFDLALECAERCALIAGSLEDPVARALAHSLMGMSLHLAGDYEQARIELEAAQCQKLRSRRTSAVYLGVDGGVLARSVLGRTLWLQGFPEQGVKQAHVAIDEAEQMNHPLTISIALVWGISVFLWTGDLASAERHIERLVARAGPHSLHPYLVVGRGFEAELSIRRGNFERGIETLQECLDELHSAPYELLTTPLEMALVQGLCSAGRASEALKLTNERIRSVEAHGDRCYLPELLRLKAHLTRQDPTGRPEEADRYLRQALASSQQQGARAWELRIAIDIAAALRDEGRIDAARSILQPIVDRFTEGRQTADLRCAADLLATLHSGAVIG